MEIQIQNWQKNIKVNKLSLKRAILLLSRELGLQDKELSVVLVDDSQIAELNQRYRLISGPTDVLAFPLQEGDDAEFTGGMLGDIVISLETAGRQAEQAQHSLERELHILLIHGLLHLIGYDHLEEFEAVQMRRMEEKLLFTAEAQSTQRKNKNNKII